MKILLTCWQVSGHIVWFAVRANLCDRKPRHTVRKFVSTGPNIALLWGLPALYVGWLCQSSGMLKRWSFIASYSLWQQDNKPLWLHELSSELAASLHSHVAIGWLIQTPLATSCNFVPMCKNQPVIWLLVLNTKIQHVSKEVLEIYYVQGFIPCSGNKKIFKTKTN